MKFASYTPETRERIRSLMASDHRQAIYIHENDLIHYYQNFLIHNLWQSLHYEEPWDRILKKAYQLAKQVLKEYFDNIGSSRILRSLKDVVPVMESAVSKGHLGLAEVYKVTDKENSHAAHCANVGLYSTAFGINLGMTGEPLRDLGLGGLLFDIGKKSIPYEILSLDRELTPGEFQAVRKHPSSGKKTLNEMKCFSENILRMASEHHEKLDGTGYPFRLAGEKIAYHARICAVIDVFDALICERYHRKPLSPFQALTEMKDKMKGHFDERILMRFILSFTPSKTSASR
ncbi:MAG: HD domain-containing protein [Nitrospinaceae bacterium]|nr:HD domain-containing protein [Nitrospinaceae bacterium]NIR53951.1 HD domain-containing protein [Nitrospinaceae bacterium]NIS84369.1 HD domain-containing protein [Nitrospinaceae bacterium]NIU43454.1 HD domain-containing protein [Nitrospinaceae bacterium]NIU95577.1 HD domain-containing protein [Nitrospinaceae bacterium]